MRRPAAVAALARAALLASAAWGPQAAAAAADPPVPPARISGGTPVAIISNGIDYTVAGLADRLVRDGEGELTGYDFADDDRRPYAAANSSSETALARVVLAEGQASMLVAIRANPADIATLGKAFAFAAQSPARIIVVLAQDAAAHDVARAAAVRFPDRLIIVRAPGTIHAGTANLLQVAAASAPGEASAATGADIAIPAEGAMGFDSDADVAALPAHGVACARLAALAARLQAVEPDLSATQMKARILALAKSDASAGKDAAPDGPPPFLERPHRPFWLE